MVKKNPGVCVWGGAFHDLGQHANAEALKNPLQNNQSRKIQVWQFLWVVGEPEAKI